MFQQGSEIILRSDHLKISECTSVAEIVVEEVEDLLNFAITFLILQFCIVDVDDIKLFFLKM
jgi:hypothetical protein